MVQIHGRELKTTCLCGIHVHTATKIIMWLNIFSSGLYALGLIVTLIVLGNKTDEPKPVDAKNSTVFPLTHQQVIGQVYSQLFTTVISLLLCGMVLWGLKKRRPNFYKPYLIFLLIGIILSIIGVLIILCWGIGLLSGIFAKEAQAWYRVLFGGSSIGFGISLIFFLIICVYFNYIIVNRSFKLLKAEVADVYYPVPPPYNPTV